MTTPNKVHDQRTSMEMMFDPTNDETNEAFSSATGTGLEILGRKAKELIQSIQKLRQLGIEDLGLPLPKIALIGDQSTGKSSLIEGISEIKVPRSSGTCTRCPLEINLTESTIPGEGWSCKVSLLKKYIYGGAWNSTDQAFGPWAPQDPEDFPFSIVRNKSQVPHILRLAQLATLNPSQPYENYMPGGATNPDLETQVEFSPNIIRLHISGPGLPNMSFYDLPGVISVHELAEDQYLVELVKNLVIDYIQDPNCMNLLTLPMTDDPSNSNAAVLIRRAKAEARTVGVLTKPDRIQQGESLSQWMQILENKRFLLGLGYFVVKNNPDPLVDHAIARTEEEEFFRNPPWSAGLKQFRNKFGTLQLQAFLSDRLANQMKASLPHIFEQVQRKAEQIDAELAVLPEPAEGNLMLLIVERILNFETQIKGQIDGGDPQYPLKKDCHQTVVKFRTVLQGSRPEIDEPWEGETMVDRTAASKGTPSKRKANGVDHPETPTRKLPRRQPTVLVDSESDEVSPPQLYNGRQPNAPKTVNSPYTTRFTVAQIHDIIQGSSTSLPNQTDPKVLERMINLSLENWEKPLDQFLNRTERLFQKMFTAEINKNFGHWQSTRLHTRVIEVCSTFLEEAMATEREAAKRVLQLELRSPTAYDHATLNQAVEKARAEIKADRRAYLTEVFERERINLGSPSKPAKPISKDQLGPDPSAKEYELLATVRGYYEYALSRFIDVISQGIKGGIFLKCRNELGDLIKSELGITDTKNGQEHYAQMLEVDLTTRERRIQLEKDRARVKEAREWLEGMALRDSA